MLFSFVVFGVLQMVFLRKLEIINNYFCFKLLQMNWNWKEPQVTPHPEIHLTQVQNSSTKTLKSFYLM